MRRLTLTTALLTVGLVHAAAAAEDPVDLRELAVSALRTNEMVGRADSDVRRAEARVRLARSVLLPSLELNGSTTWYQDEAVLQLSPDESFVLRPRNDWNWSADLSQVLFSGLRDWRARDVALLERDIALLRRHTAANDLVLEVAASFLEAVATDQQVEVARVTLEQIDAQLKVAERRFEVGETAAADVARWRSEHAAARQRMIVAEGSAELARRRLERLTGVRPIDALRPLGPVPPPPGDDDALLGAAYDTRLEMATLEHQLETAGLWIKIEKGSWFPQIDAHAQYFQQKAEFPASDWTSIALTARVPIYDGGLTAARVAEAREDLRQVELLGVEVTKRIADQVQAAAIRHRSAVAAYDAARERQTAAREANRQVENAYRVGEASATDLLATTAELTDAENAVIIARAQREYQAIALRHAVGLPPLPDLDPLEIVNETVEE
jgi:outer membrane protein